MSVAVVMSDLKLTRKKVNRAQLKTTLSEKSNKLFDKHPPASVKLSNILTMLGLTDII